MIPFITDIPHATPALLLFTEHSLHTYYVMEQEKNLIQATTPGISHHMVKSHSQSLTAAAASAVYPCLSATSG